MHQHAFSDTFASKGPLAVVENSVMSFDQHRYERHVKTISYMFQLQGVVVWTKGPALDCQRMIHDAG